MILSRQLFRVWLAAVLSITGFFVIAAVAARAEELPPMPAVPEPAAPGSIPLGNPKDFPETKMDFPITIRQLYQALEWEHKRFRIHLQPYTVCYERFVTGPYEPTWESIDKNYPGDPAWLRDAKFGIWVHFGPQSAGQSGNWYAQALPGRLAGLQKSPEELRPSFGGRLQGRTPHLESEQIGSCQAG